MAPAGITCSSHQRHHTPGNRACNSALHHSLTAFRTCDTPSRRWRHSRTDTPDPSSHSRPNRAVTRQACIRFESTAHYYNGFIFTARDVAAHSLSAAQITRDRNRHTVYCHCDRIFHWLKKEAETGFLTRHSSAATILDRDTELGSVSYTE